MAKAKPSTRPDLKKAASESAATTRLVVQVEAPRKRVFQAALQQTCIIGRMSEEDTSQPDIDLTSADAKNAGVSRLHARISTRGEMLYIEDLQSTNGTRINGVELVPGKSYRILASDEVEIGTMRLSARIVQG